MQATTETSMETAPPVGKIPAMPPADQGRDVSGSQPAGGAGRRLRRHRDRRDQAPDRGRPRARGGSPAGGGRPSARPKAAPASSGRSAPGLAAIGADGAAGRRVSAAAPRDRRRVRRAGRLQDRQDRPVAPDRRVGEFRPGRLAPRRAPRPPAGERGGRVAVDNDANIAALGEACHGAGAGLDPVFYVTLGSGVGGGLVVGGHVYHGAPPGEAEFGHLRLGRAAGGTGCATVESRCSGWAVDARIRERATGAGGAARRRGRGPRPARRRGPAPRGGLGRRRPGCAENARRTGGRPGAGPVARGPPVAPGRRSSWAAGLSGVGEPLRAAVAAALPGFVMEAFHPCPPVRLAALGEDAVPVGRWSWRGGRREVGA